jgi:two-component system chemotaxis sensor kinase CheA
MFGARDQQFAIPQSAIREITMARGDTVTMSQIGDHHFAAIRGQQLPVIDLAHLLGMTPHASQSDDAVLIVIDAGAGFHYILSVDQVMDQEDLVVRAGAPTIMASGIYAGTTLPDHGRPLLLIDPNGLAVHAGVSAISSDDMNANDDDEADKRNDLPLLIFRDYQQNERAMPLSAIERVEDFSVGQIAHSAGRARLTHDGRAYPLYGLDDMPSDSAIKAIRLFDGASVIYYAIQDIVDMHDIDSGTALQPIGSLQDDSPISSIFIFDGRQIELIDPHWIFSQFDNEGQRQNAEDKPICLLQASDDGWTRQMLAPLIAKAGYEVRYNLDDGEQADICIASDEMDISPPKAGEVIALRDRPIAADNGNSVYRYDRIGILGALQNSGRHKRSGGVQ